MEDSGIGQPSQVAEFKQWVLFVREGDVGSMEALKYVVAIENECMVKDVDSLTSRPPWLHGVPTLLDVKAKKKYEGSAALHQLQSVIASEPMPYDSVHKGYYAFGEDWGGISRNVDFILPTLTRDERYDATSSLTPNDVNSYMKLRTEMLDRVFGDTANKDEPVFTVKKIE